MEIAPIMIEKCLLTLFPKSVACPPNRAVTITPRIGKSGSDSKNAIFAIPQLFPEITPQ